MIIIRQCDNIRSNLYRQKVKKIRGQRKIPFEGISRERESLVPNGNLRKWKRIEKKKEKEKEKENRKLPENWTDASLEN